MKTNIYFTARELMNKWDIDDIGLYNAIEDGLPAYLGNARVSHHQLKFKLDDPNFEKLMRRLRFWRRHVELFEFGGAEAVFEGTRIRWPAMGDSLTFEMHPDPAPKKKRKPKAYIIATRKKFKNAYETEKKNNPDKVFSWLIKHRLRENVRWPDGTVIPDKRFYEWKRLLEKSELL